MLVMGLLLSCVMSVRLAVVFLAIVPVLAVVLFFIVRHVGPLYRVLQGVMDRLNDALRRTSRPSASSRPTCARLTSRSAPRAINSDLAATATKTFSGAVLNTPVFQLAMYTACVSILWTGGNMIMAGQLTVGTLTGFMSYVLQIMNSLMMISNVFLLMARALTSIRRVREVLDEARHLLAGARPDGGPGQRLVDFDHVGFRYSVSAQKDVLSDVTLHLPAGSAPWAFWVPRARARPRSCSS